MNDRELNDLLAEHVMGWHREFDEFGFSYDYYYGSDGEEIIKRKHFTYKNPAQLNQIIDEMIKDDWSYSLFDDGTRVQVVFLKEPERKLRGDCWLDDEPRAKAIVIAALRAIAVLPSLGIGMVGE